MRSSTPHSLAEFVHLQQEPQETVVVMEAVALAALEETLCTERTHGMEQHRLAGLDLVQEPAEVEVSHQNHLMMEMTAM
eukprot:4942354-Amphidinium_carterae.1